MGLFNLENAQARLDSGFWNTKCVSCDHDEKKHGDKGCTVNNCECPADPECNCKNCEGMFS